MTSQPETSPSEHAEECIPWAPLSSDPHRFMDIDVVYIEQGPRLRGMPGIPLALTVSSALTLSAWRITFVGMRAYRYGALDYVWKGPMPMPHAPFGQLEQPMWEVLHSHWLKTVVAPTDLAVTPLRHFVITSSEIVHEIVAREYEVLYLGKWSVIRKQLEQRWSHQIAPVSPDEEQDD